MYIVQTVDLAQSKNMCFWQYPVGKWKSHLQMIFIPISNFAIIDEMASGLLPSELDLNYIALCNFLSSPILQFGDWI